MTNDTFSTRWRDALCVWLCAGPLFVLTVRGWPSIVLFTGALAASAFLLLRRAPSHGLSAADMRAGHWVLASLFLPLVAVAFSALLRGDPYPAVFDAPSRLWAAIPVFLLAVRWRLDAAKVLQWTLPLALAVTLGHQWFAHQPRIWGPGRMSTYFADPLVFGYLSLAFGLMTLMSVSIDDVRRGPAWAWVLKLLAVAASFYLSIASGSRSGWLAIPLVFAIWLHMNVRARSRWGRLGVPLAGLLAACIAAAGVYSVVPKVHDRVHEALDDLSGYSFEGVAPNSPVGLRVTYMRMAAEFIGAHPIAGVGDTSHMDEASAPPFPYASAEARHTALVSAFHNQVVSNTVRYGVLGGLAALLLLLAPLAVYARQLSWGTAAGRRAAAMGLAYGIVIAVSSVTTEVVDLKYTASLYALMTALLCGASLARHGQD